VRFVPIARARLCFLPRKGEFSAFLTLFGEKSHQRVRARKAPKPLRRALFSFHRTHKSLHFAIRRLFQTLDLRVTVYSRSNFTRARAFYTTTQKNGRNFAYLARTKTPSRFCTASLFGSRASCIPCNTFVEFLESVYDVRKRPRGVSFRKFLAKLPLMIQSRFAEVEKFVRARIKKRKDTPRRERRIVVKLRRV
jgi:hypothetical protein